MAVSIGAPVKAITVNSTFADKISDDTIVSVWELDNTTDPNSGSPIPNLQQAVNESTPQLSSQLSIGAGGEITLSEAAFVQKIAVSGSGAVNLSLTPFGSGLWQDGAIIRLVGTDDINTVNIIHNDNANGAVLNGDALLKKYCILELLYDSTLNRFIELARNF